MNPIIFESLLPLKKHIAILVHELIIARTLQSNPSNANIETCVFFPFSLDHMAVLKHLVKQDCSLFSLLFNSIKNSELLSKAVSDQMIFSV